MNRVSDELLADTGDRPQRRRLACWATREERYVFFMPALEPIIAPFALGVDPVACASLFFMESCRFSSARFTSRDRWSMFGGFVRKSKAP